MIEERLNRIRALAAEAAKNRPQQIEEEKEREMAGRLHARARAVEAAARRLQQAARFMELSAKSPVWTRRMGKGNASLLLRFEVPGVLAVYDPDTLQLLAISMTGKKSQEPQFVSCFMQSGRLFLLLESDFLHRSPYSIALSIRG